MVNLILTGPSFHTPATSISYGYETSCIILRSSPRFLTPTRFYLVCRATITNCIARFQRRRCQSQPCQPQLRSRPCPRDTQTICAHPHIKTTALATVSAAPFTMANVSVLYRQLNTLNNSGDLGWECDRLEKLLYLAETGFICPGCRKIPQNQILVSHPFWFRL